MLPSNCVAVANFFSDLVIHEALNIVEFGVFTPIISDDLSSSLVTRCDATQRTFQRNCASVASNCENESFAHNATVRERLELTENVAARNVCSSTSLCEILDVQAHPGFRMYFHRIYCFCFSAKAVFCVVSVG